MLNLAIYVIIIIVLSSFIQLNLNRKWKLIYTTYGYQNYFTMIGKLKKNGIEYKTKLPMSFNGRRFNENTQYDIYVKKDLEHLALQSFYEN
ncbi:hypothetical protein [Gottfriedia acidiceleris]|uniref:LAGLIDADG homing endonuclease n=1 Tax=Gottfriedia acidiceleris TaxID=371036 RepID=A0ABY4JHH7_9BACI|nr:hypothetical protein [Gottfriedia acidiceleris]UPM52927.1 hypothetical protein MY490_13960 [Gottfriedia acidiceleris]